MSNEFSMSDPRASINVFDQSARFVAKADPPGFLRWLVLEMDPTLEFRGWLDTRSLPFPGEPDRTSDTVADLLDPADPATRWALATEFQAGPDAEILDRLLEYLARLRRELRHGPRRRDKFRVAAGLVQLTGRRPAETLDMTHPGANPVGLRLTVALKSLRDEKAAVTLAEIADGRLGRWILPWIPLMNGGGKPTMIEEWKRLALLEPDRRARGSHGAIALIFAGLARRHKPWKQALEGWNVTESPIVNEWKAEGEAKGKRESLLQFLRLRFTEELPSDLLSAIESESDLGRLARGIAAAAKAASIEQFRAISRI